jgi:hypothetical protein
VVTPFNLCHHNFISYFQLFSSENISTFSYDNKSNGLLDRLNFIKNSNQASSLHNVVSTAADDKSKVKYFESTSISNSNESDENDDTSASLSERNGGKNHNNNNNNFEDALKYDEEDKASDHLFYGAHDMSDVDLGYTKRQSYEHYDDVKRNLNFDDDGDEDINGDENKGNEKCMNETSSDNEDDDEDDESENFENLKRALKSGDMANMIQVKSQPKSLARKKTKSCNKSLINTSMNMAGTSFSSIGSSSTLNTKQGLSKPHQQVKQPVKHTVSNSIQQTTMQSSIVNSSKISSRTGSVNSLASASEIYHSTVVKSSSGFSQSGKDSNQAVGHLNGQLSKNSLKSSSMANFASNVGVVSTGRRKWK